MDDITRLWDQHVASLKHDARQLRLAMEADGPADTKTRKRTKGAATRVQAVHGDSCSETRVDPGPKTNSTNFGMKDEPPDLPCGEDVLVENGAAAPKSCLPSLDMRTTTAAGGLLTTGETSMATKITFNEPPLRFTRPRRRIQRRQSYGFQFHPPGTTAVFGEINYLLPPPAGGLSRQNRCKIGRSIQAVLKVVSAPARVWDRGARCFVVRLYVLERLDEAAAFFAEE